MIESTEDRGALEEYIDQMQRIAVRLRSLGLGMLVTTLFNLGVVGVGWEGGDGQVVEDDTHDELLKLKGLYAELWAHQSGEFL